MTYSRDKDTEVWLKNKLDSAEENWVPSSISGIIKPNTIDSINRCFPVLTTKVKLKLLSGILHLPRDAVKKMKSEIEEMIEFALDDSNMWVEFVANLIKTYPTTLNVNADVVTCPTIQNLIQQLSDKAANANPFANLPMECQVLNHTTLRSLLGSIPPVRRHFSLMKKPKSALLKAELLRKSSEAANQLRKGSEDKTASVPIKHRSRSRPPAGGGSMPGILSKPTMGRSDNPRNPSPLVDPSTSKTVSRISGRPQAGGTRLLDISEQPILDNKGRTKRQQNTAKLPQSRKEDQTGGSSQKVVNLEPAVAPSLPPHAGSTETVPEEPVPEASSVKPQSLITYEFPINYSQEPIITVPLVDPAVVIQLPDFVSSQAVALSSLQAISSPQDTSSVSLQRPTQITEEESEPCQGYEESEKVGISTHQRSSAAVYQPVHAVDQEIPIQNQSSVLSPISTIFYPNSTPALHQYDSQRSTLAQSLDKSFAASQRQRATAVVREPVPLSQRENADPQHQTTPFQGPSHHEAPLQRSEAATADFCIQRSPPRLPRQVLQPLEPHTVSLRVREDRRFTPRLVGAFSVMEAFNELESRDFFNNANRLNPDEKSLIFDFMLGDRENPFPENGDVIKIVVSESVQNMLHPNGDVFPAKIETIVQLDYKTGQMSKTHRFKSA